MRLAVLIIALCLTMLLGLQSCAATVGGSLLHDQGTAGSGAVGLLLAFIFVVAAALVMNFPRVSAALFLLGGILAVSSGLQSQFTDLVTWGCVSVALSLMALVGSRELARTNRQTLYVPVAEQPDVATSPHVGSAKRSALVPVLVLGFALAVVIGVFASGLLRLDRFIGNAAAPTNATGPAETPVGNGVGPSDDSVEVTAETNVTPSDAGSNASAFVDSNGRADDAPSSAPAVTAAWLAGSWRPASAGESADRQQACDTDDIVTYSSGGGYQDGEGAGIFATDGRSITYSHRVLVDEAEGTEDRSQYNHPKTTQVEAVNSDMMREDGALYTRCAS